MKIISWNVNGIRAVHKKGELFNFINLYKPDIFCIQETKAEESQLKNIKNEFDQYIQFYESAEKKGYSGTSIWILKDKFQYYNFHSGMNDFYEDKEGRISRVDLENNITIITVYFPNGGKSENAWQEKLIFYKKFLDYIKFLEKEGKKVVFCGDINTCHHEIDIARPKENEGKIGFHIDERNCLTEWENSGWKDAWRHKNKDVREQYSWWSYRGGARSRNVGWRIDYFFVPKNLLNLVKDIKYLNDQMGSDHCPILLEL